MNKYVQLAVIAAFAAVPELAMAAEEIDGATTVWMMISTALVLLMMPGLAMFYGGLVDSKNVLSTMMHTFIGMGFLGVIWVAVGYSLTFGESILGGFWGWNSDYFFLQGIDESIVDGIPEYILAMFQGMFAIITPALISGSLAERVTMRGYLLFICLWFFAVYAPLCHWIWGADGWLLNYGAAGVIDLAGGLVIHVSAGTSALVAAIFVGPRKGWPNKPMMPGNLVMTMMGAGLLWMGWFGFNAGSTLGSGLDTVRALTMTQISAATGAVAWTIIEMIKYKKVTALGFASGILAGLVVITPAAGVVKPVGAMVLGTCSACLCFWALSLKEKLGYDDSLDCFGIHGVGSGLGVLLLAFFIRDSWMEDAAAAAGGSWTAIDQLGVQAVGMGTTIALSIVATLVICKLIDATVGFRVDEDIEANGLDLGLHGEHGYDL